MLIPGSDPALAAELTFKIINGPMRDQLSYDGVITIDDLFFTVRQRGCGVVPPCFSVSIIKNGAGMYSYEWLYR